MNYPQIPHEERRLIRTEALPVQDALILSDAPLPEAEMVLVVLWFDFSDRPDLSDLPRIHQDEPGGETTLTWMVEAVEQPIEATFYLQVEMHTPVCARFVLSFPMCVWSELVETLARCGTFGILEGPAPDWRGMIGAGTSTENLLDTIHELSGPGVQISMEKDAHDSLRGMYAEWDRHWQKLLK